MFSTVKEIVARRELLALLVVSKLKKDYREFVLGYLWWLVEPLLMMVVYWVFVAILQGRVGDNYPFFILCGLIPFRAMAMTLGHSSSAISSSFSLLSQMTFPRIFLPLTGVIENQVKLCFGLLVLLLLSIKWGSGLSVASVLGVIPPFVMLTVLLMGLSMLFSIIGVYVRDLTLVVNFINRFIVFLSPVLYSMDRIPERFHDIYLLNPLAVVVVELRSVLLSMPGVSVEQQLRAWGVSLVVFLLGYLVFTAKQHKVMKVL